MKPRLSTPVQDLLHWVAAVEASLVQDLDIGTSAGIPALAELMRRISYRPSHTVFSEIHESSIKELQRTPLSKKTHSQIMREFNVYACSGGEAMLTDLKEYISYRAWEDKGAAHARAREFAALRLLDANGEPISDGSIRVVENDIVDERGTKVPSAMTSRRIKPLHKPATAEDLAVVEKQLGPDGTEQNYKGWGSW